MVNLKQTVSDLNSKFSRELTPQAGQRPRSNVLWSDVVIPEDSPSVHNSEANAAPQSGEEKVKALFKEAINETVTEKEAEMKEREKRANNVIIFKAKEPESKTRQERVDEDEKLVQGLVEDIGAENVTIDNIVRLGRKDKDKCRPVRFRLQDENEKSELMSKLHYLKEADEPYASLVVSHDLTPKQREEKQNLYDKAAGDVPDGYRIVVKSAPGPRWDPKVVKLKIRMTKS